MTQKQYEKALERRKIVYELAEAAGLQAKIDDDWYGDRHHWDDPHLTKCVTCGAYNKRRRLSLIKYPYCLNCKKEREKAERRVVRREKYLKIIQDVLKFYPGSECLTPEEDIRGDYDEKVRMRCEEGHEWNALVHYLEIAGGVKGRHKNNWCKKCFYEKGWTNHGKEAVEDDAYDFKRYYQSFPEKFNHLLEEKHRKIQIYAKAVGCELVTEQWMGRNYKYRFRCELCNERFSRYLSYLYYNRDEAVKYLCKNGWHTKDCYNHFLAMAKGSLDNRQYLARSLGLPYDVGFTPNTFVYDEEYNPDDFEWDSDGEDAFNIEKYL